MYAVIGSGMLGLQLLLFSG